MQKELLKQEVAFLQGDALPVIDDMRRAAAAHIDHFHIIVAVPGADFRFIAGFFPVQLSSFSGKRHPPRTESHRKHDMDAVYFFNKRLM